ncbi:MAG: glycosyltransferase family 4 protein [Phormidesmis sp. CAN_BIN36]|nr:glycosyltransferase family 4 protein [Phormidesmis sp. CAN_BIN36]
MRILHVLNHIQKIGNGIVNVTIDLACLQAQAGHDVAVASSGGEFEELLSDYGVRHFEIDQRRRPVTLIRAVPRFWAIVKAFEPNIIHAHMMTGVVFAKLLKGGAKYAIVSTVHNEFQRSAILMGLADRVIAISQAVEISMRQRGIAASKLRVVANGTLGSPRCRPLSEVEPLPLRRAAITTVAGMFHRKGIKTLIDAFTEVSTHFPAHLYLVGDGEDRAEFERHARKSPVSDRIHFEGFQPEPQRYLLATDIFVLASDREPFGLVLSEAREAGCAIVATHVDGIPEVLENGKAGLLVPPRDVSTLAKTLTQLLSNPKQLAMWRQRAPQNLEWLSVRRVHRETLEVYESAIRGALPSRSLTIAKR